MVEKKQIFSSRINYEGVVSFSDYYKFCYDWLTKQIDLILQEKNYIEKIKGDTKDLSIDWSGEKPLTDYFKFEILIQFRVFGLKNVEIFENKQKVKTNKGRVEMQVNGTLIRDYSGKFETTPFRKFMRNVYEKWIISSEIEKFEEYIMLQCDEFLKQAKAYLDLEGKF
jgi:hypothetical protein